ncbi:Zn(II)2Cys6 transcription factor domain-containing protein [Aspergillus puulaauensis]|uniref:Zn(2)-C6 fungal-type domain-containing protein n=1 Tax=Aspergillus puulaauensis TaxID=1220207 RepID=A0A7R7XH53_9EURO|nr:uncharacterized protein APUU_21315A [Aspergillus puulaauensis]BCS20883.1 hypothetical protein APUU_21315A [Aspergillus puulaauensis]
MESLSCSQCSRQYASYSAYNRHRKTHDRTRWHSCDICDLQFSRSDVLHRHKQIHGESSGGSNSVRQRSIRACDECRRGKIRCDNGNPCRNCLKAGKACAYRMKSTRPSVRDFPKRSAANKSRSEAATSATVTTASSSSQNESLISTMLSPASALEPATGAPNLLSQAAAQPVVDFESLLPVPLPETNAVPLWSGPQINTAGKLNGLGLDWNGSLGKDASFTHIGDISMAPGLGADLSNSYMAGPTKSMGYMPSIIPPAATQRKPPEVVHGIVQEAVDDFQQFPMNDVVFRCRKRRALSQLFDSSFGGLDAPKSASHVLHSFVTCFFDEFHHMWPIMWRQGFDYDAVEPLLYLTMTSIGAIYAGTSRAKAYGMSMLHSLKAAVVSACLACPEHEDKLDQIFEALLLLAIASLHLGHARTPKYIHQARAVLASHARRVNLFSETPAPDSQYDGEESLTRWIKLERKRRMAFAFLRWEAISSILLNTSPQLSCEELCLKIPCNQELWLYVGPDWRERLLTARQEAAFHPMYAELFWHLHGSGTGSLSLTPLSAPIHELMLYGLHLPLGTTPLHTQHALRSPDWESVKRMLNPISLYDRENLSAWLLYHLAYIRIHSNMNLFKIPSTDSDVSTAPFEQQRINDLTCWSTTTSAKVALYHACQIWYLITATLQQDDLVTPYFPNQRAASQHNIVAIICLYYAGVVMRTMADLCPTIDAQILQPRHIMGETLLTSYNIHVEIQKLGDVASRLCPSSEETSWLVTEIKALSLGGWLATSPAVDIWEL